MRIGTISFPAIDNYGAILQAQALINVLAREGHEAWVLDYQVRNLKFLNRFHTMHLSYMRHAPWPVLAAVPELLVRFTRIEQFRRRYLDRTRSVWRDDEMHEVARQFDTIITGSDEVFRTDKRGDIFPSLFLDFAEPDRQKLVAYAACSAGIDDYGKKTDEVAKLLNRFHSISVRDEMTRVLVKKLTGTDPEIVLDPTLLWQFEELPLPEPPEKNFLLVYGFFRSPETDRMVRETAERLGLSMISVGWASKYAHRNLMAADTLQWLSYIKHAKLVFTNCFHGLMFSTVYQRDFLVFESEQARYKLHDFINRFSLSDRMIRSGESPTGKQLEGMDHVALQQQLQPLASRSIRFLQEAAEPLGIKVESNGVAYELNGHAATLPEELPLASLPAWRTLTAKAAETDPETWQVLDTELAGKVVRNPHDPGDFAPQNHNNSHANEQQTNGQKSGQLYGVPGWDWFHFVVQTAIVTKQYPVERVAAEVGQMLHSEKFQKYANATGISGFVEPLFLAYLLHQKWVAKSCAGETVPELFELLSTRWHLVPATPASTVATTSKPPRSNWYMDAMLQLKFAAAQVVNLFWEPSLTAKIRPSMVTIFRRDWPVILLAGLMLGIIGLVQHFADPHLVFLPFYFIPCALLTWKVDRRWGTVAAIAGTVIGPLVVNASHAGYYKLDTMLWNMAMRLFILQLCVQFVEQIHRQKKLSRRHAVLDFHSTKFAENWAVVLACGLFLLTVVVVDFETSPRMGFLPLYLLPCITLTLTLNRNWGIGAAVVAMLFASLGQYATNPDCSVAEALGWNFAMRMVVALTVIQLLDSIRFENILFVRRKPRTN